MGCFREWLATILFASLLGSRVEQLVKCSHYFVASVGRIGLVLPTSWIWRCRCPAVWAWCIPCDCASHLQCWKQPRAAKSTCFQPWHEGVLCCNRYQAAAWHTLVFTALCRDSSLQIWCLPLSGDAGFNYTVSCRGNVPLSSLCTVQSNSFVGGWWIQTHCSWACQPGTEDGNLSNFWDMGNFPDWKENPIAGLSKHQLCAGRLARKSLPPIFSWNSSQVFNTLWEFWVMNRVCKENSM